MRLALIALRVERIDRVHGTAAWGLPPLLSELGANSNIGPSATAHPEKGSVDNLIYLGP